MSTSLHLRARTQHSAHRKIVQFRSFGFRLSVSLATLLAFSAVMAASFAQRSDAQGNQLDREDTFSEKADKLLKRVRKATDEDRATAAKGKLTRETSEVDRLSRTVGVERRNDNRVTVDVAVRLTNYNDVELKANGFSAAARMGDIATLETEVDRLPELASLTSVQKISAAVKRYPLNDRARQSVGIDNASGQRTVVQTGRGVVVAIIDTGIDFRHADFTVPGSGGRQTRIKALLDMTVYGSQTPDPGWNYVLPGESALIGHLYTEANINAALQAAKPADQNADSVKQRDKNGHGTHVAATAAGNGLASPSVGTYSGMAPEADLIIVKASRQNDDTASFRTTDIINALQFVQQKAAELNEPFAANLSLGGQLGPHDGTSPDERAIDNLVNAGTGRAVCVAAGNEGDSSIHARATVPTGGNLTLDFNVNGAAEFVDLYQANSDRFSVTVTRPDGVTLGPVSYDPNGFSLPDGQASDQYLQIFNANDDKGDSDPSNDQPDIFLVFKPGAPNGMWKIKLEDADGNANQSFDAWAEGEGVYFSTSVDRNSHLVASPGTARGAITVGAFVTRSATQTIGAPASFTSPGPTADGRQKPEISAPGYYLYSARSTDVADPDFGTIGTGSNAPTDSLHYTGLAGTSMATPVTTGGVALLLQANPAVRNDQIKTYMTDNADHDGFDPAGWNSRFGFGKLNIAATLDAMAGTRKYVISGRVNIFGDSSVIVNLSGSQSQQVHIDGNGNYSFTGLSAGGNYTVTPTSLNYIFTPTNQTFNDLRSNQTFDFNASLKRFRISGRVIDSNGVGVSNVSLSGERDGVGGWGVSTDERGFYILDSQAAGVTYKLTPYLPLHTFSPVSKTFNNLSSDQVFDFVMNPNYKIEGKVTDLSGAPVSGIFVSINTPVGSNVGVSVLTDARGFYSFDAASAGNSYSVTPLDNSYTFSPQTQVVSNIAGNQTANFVAQPVSPQIRFGSTLYSPSENSRSALITITRTGNLSGEATVDYRTSDTDTFTVGCADTVNNHGSAYARCDFATTVGTLSFARGEADKTFFIPIIDDSYAEGNETFTVQLSNPTGATLGSPATATVIILDNDSVNGPNPIFTTPFFVRQHYLDFLGREPEAGQPWSAVLNNCSDVNNNPACDRLTVSGAFFGSPEFKFKGGYIIGSYRLAFDRLPQYSEFVIDLAALNAANQVDAFAKRAAFADAFVLRTEFASYAAMSNANYVTSLMGRYSLSSIFTPDPANPDGTNKLTLTTADLTNRLNGIGGTLTRAQVLRAIAQSDEVNSIEALNVFVASQYYGYLRRTPETGGFNGWITYLIAHPGDFRAMVNGFVNSTEYRLRFGPP